MSLNRNIIQSLWIGENLTLLAELSIKSFLANDFHYHLYTYNKNLKVPENVILKDSNEIVGQDLIFTYKNGSYAAFSNLFRFALLYKKGGIWSDTDIICLKNFKIKNQYIFSSEIDKEYKDTFITPFFIKARKNSQAMKYAMNECLILRDQVISGEIEWGIGNKVLTDTINKFKLEKYISDWQTFTTCNCHDVDSFFNPNYDKNQKIPVNLRKISKKTLGIHLWNEILRRRNIDISDEFDENSLIEELKKKYV